MLAAEKMQRLGSRQRSALGWLAAGLLALSLSSCRRAQPIPPPPTVIPSEAAAAVPALLPSVQRGMSFVHSWESRGHNGYGSEASRKSLAELRALGTDWISVMPFGFMSGLDADSIRLLSDRGPGSLFAGAGESDERVQKQVADAHAAGLKVLLKPHLWIARGAWCGEIELGPPGTPGSDERWARFFQSYERYLTHYAQLAQSTGADLLSVGVELRSTTARFPTQWRNLIAKARQHYQGPLVYAANWDEVKAVTFWDALDFVGTQFYAPLAEAADSPDAVLQARLSAQLDELQAVAHKTGRKVLFTEVGYKSIRGTAVQPHLWPEHLPKGTALQVSTSAQEQAYRVFFQGLAGRDWVAGVYIWKWFSDPDSQEEDAGGFSPRGKPAAAVLQAAYAGASSGLRAAPAAPTPAPGR